MTISSTAPVKKYKTENVKPQSAHQFINNT